MNDTSFVVLTGANGGLGLETARALAGRGLPLLLACRRLESAEQTRRELLARGVPGEQVRTASVDVSDLASVRRLAAEAPRVRALVCNAGLQIVTGMRQTPRGLEETFATNHLGHFLLARLLLPRMEEGGRIVFVSSNTHDPTKHTGMPAPRMDDLEALATGKAFADEPPAVAGRRRYTTSKLCNVLCAHELARRLEGSPERERGLRVSSFDPGLMPGTGLAREYGPVAAWAWRHLMPVMTALLPNVNSTAASGRRLAAVVDGSLAVPNGGYVSRGRVETPSALSQDLALARGLWELSSRLVELPAELGAEHAKARKEAS